MRAARLARHLVGGHIAAVFACRTVADHRRYAHGHVAVSRAPIRSAIGGRIEQRFERGSVQVGNTDRRIAILDNAETVREDFATFAGDCAREIAAAASFEPSVDEDRAAQDLRAVA